jgi:hypothetical protein
MDISTIVAFSFSGVALLFCAWVILSKHKLISKNAVLQNKILVLESRLLNEQHKPEHAPVEKKSALHAKLHEVHEQSHNNSEVMLLRKEIAKFKEEIKKLKDENRQKERALKEEEVNTRNKLYSLTEENAKLVVQLREFDQVLKSTAETTKKQVPLVEFEKKVLEVSQLKFENEEMKIKFHETEKIKKQNVTKLSALQEKLKNTEQELQKWVDSSRLNDGKALDPSEFLRWYDRAMSARKMYQLMRQMRELSDNKLRTYQDGVIELSKWVLIQKNIPLPTISSSEVLADRLLAEAWNAILPTTPSLHYAEKLKSIEGVSSKMSD